MSASLVSLAALLAISSSAAAAVPQHTNTTSSAAAAAAANTSTLPVAAACGPSTANITCIQRYGSVLPPTFSRDPDPNVAYSGTVVADDASWAALVPRADFVVFDHERGLALLGPAPTISHTYVPLLNVIHGAPVFVAELNKLFVTQYGPPGNLSSLAIDLATDPPTVEAFVTDPPVYQPAGGVLHDGMIYWAVQGSVDANANAFLPSKFHQRPGIVRLDPRTLKAEWLLNNYHGFAFSGPKDLALSPSGDIYFTDSDYATGLGLSAAPPANQLATYRFRPSTGEVQIVDASLQHPNGIAFAPDGRTLYVTDSGVESVGPPGTESDNGGAYAYPIRIALASTGARNIYAWDVSHVTRPAGADGAPTLTNKRAIFQSVEGVPDGLKAAANGYLVVASGLSNGVDVLDAQGGLVARVQARHPVQAVAFGGEEGRTLFLVGIGGVTRVEWELRG